MSEPIGASESEVLLLQHDVRIIHAACQQAAREHVIDVKNHAEFRYYKIAADLWQKQINHCAGVSVLLAAELFDSAVVVNRAAYETAIALVYLMTVGDKLRNANLFEAHMVVDTAAVYANEPGDTAAKARKAIATIPEDILSEVRKNRKTRRPWSGKTIAEMAAAIEMVGRVGPSHDLPLAS
jgi:Family of unknown function (DUF5677)